MQMLPSVYMYSQCRSIACSQGMPAVLYFSRHACKQERKESSKFSFDLIDYVHTHNYVSIYIYKTQAVFILLAYGK